MDCAKRGIDTDENRFKGVCKREVARTLGIVRLKVWRAGDMRLIVLRLDPVVCLALADPLAVDADTRDGSK